MLRSGMNFRKWIMGRIVVPVLRHLPVKHATNFVESIGHFEYYAVPGLKRQTQQAVALANSRLNQAWDVPSLSRVISGRLTRWRLRDVLLDAIRAEDALATFDVVGREHMEAARAEGRGVILLSNHFGSHVLPGHWMLRQGIDFRFLTERPRCLGKKLAAYFKSTGPLGQQELFISRKKHGNDGVASIFRSIRSLKAGHMLLIACDVRWADNQSVAARFLGETWKFTPMWALLAQRSGAPVLPCYCTMLPDGRHRLEFGPVVHVSQTDNLTEVVQQALSQVERRVLQDPSNSNEYFFWVLDDRPATLALKLVAEEAIGAEKTSIPSPHFDITADVAAHTDVSSN